HSGPFHHSLLDFKSDAEIPRVSRSAGFSVVLTYLHCWCLSRVWISDTLLATKVFQRDEEPAIHFKAVDESPHVERGVSSGNAKASMTVLIKLASMSDEQSSNLG